MFEYYKIDTLINEPSSFWINLIITILGTSIGFLGAFWLANRTYKKQLKTEYNAKLELYKDRLRYMLLLIESALKSIEKQTDNFEDLAKEYKKDPTEKHLLRLIASNDLHRLQAMDTEEVFRAYFLVIPNNSEKNNDYKKIYGYIDFLFRSQKQTIESTEKQVGFVYRDQMFIKKTIEKLTNQMYKWIKRIEKEDPAYSSLGKYSFLVHYHMIYTQLIEEQSKLRRIEEEFLIPFGQLLLKDYKYEEYFGEIHNLASKAIIRFNHLKMNSDNFANDLNSQRSLMKNSFESLTAIKNKLQGYLN